MCLCETGNVQYSLKKKERALKKIRCKTRVKKWDLNQELFSLILKLNHVE